MSDAVATASGSPVSNRITVLGLLLLAALAAVIALRQTWTASALTLPLERLQSFWFDSYQRLHPRTAATIPAVVVEIDEASLAQLGQWPWPRTQLAQLIRAIERHGPAAIGIDIWMPEADRLSPQQLLAGAGAKDPLLAQRLAVLPSNDADLAAAIRAGPVVLGMVATPEPTGKTLRSAPIETAAQRGRVAIAELNINHVRDILPNIDELEDAATGHGLISTSSQEKDVVRRIPLVSDVHGTLTPALAVDMLRVALRAPRMLLHVDGTAVQGVSIGKVGLPTEGDGAMRVYYSGRDPRRYVSALEVLRGSVDPVALRDKLIVVGMTGLAATDYQSTPVGESMPGSEIHAQLLENVVDQSWLTRPSWAQTLELVLFLLLGLVLIFVTPRWKPVSAALLATACVALLVVASYAAFRLQRQVFDAATPSVALLILFSFLLVLTLSEATRRRRALEQVVQAQRVEAAYISGELQAAQRIQTGILPRSDSLREEGRIDLVASMTPAREVGGDLYDFFLLDANRLFFMIGDVAGKGLSASIFMVISKALYKSATLRRPDATISELMRAANEEVSRDNPEMFFVTAFAGILDLATGTLTYCNAGHDDPYVLGCARGSVSRLSDAAGPPLCSVENFDYESASRRMQPGELLCLVTDGVVDAQNPSGKRYGSGRLQALLARLSTGETTARGVVDAVREDVRSFAGSAEPADDVTVMAWRWLGTSRG